MYRHFTTLTSLVRNSNKYNYIERGRSNMNGHYNTKQARVKLSFGSTSNISEEKNVSSSSSPFPRWPSSMIESEGDYRDEVHLERIIGIFINILFYTSLLVNKYIEIFIFNILLFAPYIDIIIYRDRWSSL